MYSARRMDTGAALVAVALAVADVVVGAAVAKLVGSKKELNLGF